MRSGFTVRALTAGAVATACALGLSGCSTLSLVQQLAGGSNESLLEHDASIHNSQLADTVAELQQVLLEEAPNSWEPPVGGNVRRDCSSELGTSAYLYFGSWFSPEGAMVGGDETEVIAQLRTWLEENGWEDIEEYEFEAHDPEGQGSFGAAVGVEATKLDAGVSTLMVSYHYEGNYGYEYPHLVLDVDSPCTIADLEIAPSGEA